MIHHEALLDYNEARVEALKREIEKRDETIRKLKSAIRRMYVSNSLERSSSKQTAQQSNAGNAIQIRKVASR